MSFRKHVAAPARTQRQRQRENKYPHNSSYEEKCKLRWRTNFPAQGGEIERNFSPPLSTKPLWNVLLQSRSLPLLQEKAVEGADAVCGALYELFTLPQLRITIHSEALEKNNLNFFSSKFHFLYVRRDCIFFPSALPVFLWSPGEGPKSWKGRGSYHCSLVCTEIANIVECNERTNEDHQYHHESSIMYE